MPACALSGMEVLLLDTAPWPGLDPVAGDEPCVPDMLDDDCAAAVPARHSAATAIASLRSFMFVALSNFELAPDPRGRYAP